MYDHSQEQLEIAQSMQAHLTKSYLKKGMLSQEMVDRVPTGLTVTSDIDEAVSDADLVSESIIEDIDIKKDFYADFAPR